MTFLMINDSLSMRTVVKEYKFKVLKGKEGITISMGIVCNSDTNIKTSDDLINFADNALFEAKKKGRDQVMVQGSP